MTKRSKRILSLLLSSAMVFTMNTAAFAGEASVDNQINKDDKGKVITEITFAEGTNKGVKDVATIKNTDDPVSWNRIDSYGHDLMETVLEGNDSTDDYLNYSKKKHVSNNSSESDYVDLLNLKEEDYNSVYDLADLSGGYYLFLKYYLHNDQLVSHMGYVENNDDFVFYDEVKRGERPEIPVAEWDGRAIDYNKSGLSKSSKGKVEALNVKIALVKYENGTVTEIPGVEVGSVKVDKKAVKQPSVSGSAITVEKDYKYWDGEAVKTEKEPISEYKIVNGATLPTFTVTAKIGKEAAAQKKAIADALKAKKYTFAIRKGTIDVQAQGLFAQGAYDLQTKELNKAYNDCLDALDKEIENLTSETNAIEDSLEKLNIEKNDLEAELATLNPAVEADAQRIEVINERLGEITGEIEDKREEKSDCQGEKEEAERELRDLLYYGPSYYQSEYGFKPSLSANGIEKAIENAQVDTYSGAQDLEAALFDDLRMTKFNGKKATIVNRVWTGDSKKGYNKSADVVLKEKKDYTLETGSLAGETVTVLSFPETSNYEYKKSGVEVYQNNVNGLASIGYKYAFRVAPTNKKLFRTGVFKADNEGFVYSAE